MTADSRWQRPTYLQSYGRLDTNLPIVPDRSRLFRLAPVGVGTAEVESLTSYIARLAYEHCVSPRKMLCKEALYNRGKRSPYYSSSPLFPSTLINGISSLSEIAITAFEKLTLRSDLRYTTLFTWKEIFCSQHLMRTKRAWCAICYEEQLAQGSVVYEPLIWTIRSISICSHHRNPLSQMCQHCGTHSDFLGTNYRPGYCSRCLQWLGAKSKSTIESRPHNSLDTPILSHQLAVVDCVGELLSGNSDNPSPLKQQAFLKSLARIIEIHAGGNINLFSERTGLWSGNVRRLLSGESKLRMEVLCQLCISIDISPTELLNSPIEKSSDDSSTPPEREKHTKKPVILWGEIEGKFQESKQEIPPPSLEAFARRIGYYPARLKANFPSQCDELISRYRDFLKDQHPSPKVVRQTFTDALQESPPPSLQTVLRRLGCRDTGWYYYNNYSDLCFAISGRYKKSRNKPFSKEILVKKLKAALTEQPPPSLSSIAKRLGHRREFFRLKYPELTKAIASRHMEYRKHEQERIAARLRQMIREAIREIMALGQYTSEARVKEYVRPRLFKLGRDSLFKEALREVKTEMGLGR